MVNVRTEKDPERLRQVAVLLDDEVARLHKELARLAQENAALRGLSEEQAQGMLDGIATRLAAAAPPNKPSKSERRRRRRRGRDDEAKKRTQFGPREQSRLLVDEQIVALPASDCACEACGLPLAEMAGGFESSEYIDVIERQYIVRRTKRQKYTKTCGCPGPIVTAPYVEPPDTLGGRYSVAFCATVAEEKYLDHNPLRRQERGMDRMGLEVSSAVLVGCLWQLTLRVSATYDALRDDILAVDVVHIDETGWRAIDAVDETRELWGMTSERGAYYRILDNRSHEGARTMLGDFGGWIMTDGLKVYDKAERIHGYKHGGCWAHVRRRFFEIENDFPEVTELLDWMDELFAIERDIDETHFADPFGQRRAYRAAVRDERSRPIVAKIYAWLTDGKPPPGTALEKAVNYVHGQWAKLKLFLDHPELPLSNNAAERALRGSVIGKKNFAGTRSKRGELIAAMLYTIFETARLRGIDGRAYLMAIARHDLAEDRREKDAPDGFVRRPLLPDDYLRALAEGAAA